MRFSTEASKYLFGRYQEPGLVLLSCIERGRERGRGGYLIFLQNGRMYKISKNMKDACIPATFVKIKIVVTNLFDNDVTGG